MIRVLAHLFLFFFVSCADDTKADISDMKMSSMNEIEIQFVKDTMLVSSEFNIQFNNKSDNVYDKLFVQIKNRFSIYAFDLSLEHSKANLFVDKSITIHSGAYLVSVFSDGLLLGETSFYLEPNIPKGKIETYFGPKSLFASDEDQSMIINIPRDEFGNPALSKVKYSKLVDQKITKLPEKNNNNLISYETLQSLEQKGKQLILASSGESSIREQELIIKSGVPNQIEIELIDYHPFADSRNNIHLVTKPVVDAHGDIVEDGTLINFTYLDAKTKKTIAQYASFTINGVATVYMSNPKTASKLKVFAHQYNSARSNELFLEFDSYIYDFELQQKGDIVLAKQVKAKLGQLVSDGTVGIAVIKSTQEIFEAESEEGDFIFKIDPSYFKTKQDSVVVTIGGISKSIFVSHE